MTTQSVDAGEVAAGPARPVPHVLEVRGVRKTYESEGAPVRALRGVDLTIAGGEFVAIMGPSGCGKSTLLNLVAGLDTPTEGQITVAGESLADKDENDLARMRRRHIGIVFQFFNLLEGMSVLENVTLPAIIAGSARRQAESRARDLLDLLGLADKAKNAPGVLSGGQRQRLAIARALANQPTLLLADEPTGALDSEGGREVLELFRRLHAGGQAIMLVTHDTKVAEAATRIVRMRDGRIAETEVRVRATAQAPGPAPRPPGSGRRQRQRQRRLVLFRAALSSLDLTQPTGALIAAPHGRGWLNPLAAVAAVTGAGLALSGATMAQHGADHAGEVVQVALVVAWAAVGLTVTIRRPAERLGPAGAGRDGRRRHGQLGRCRPPGHGGATHLSATVVAAAQLARPLTVAVLPIVAMHVMLGLPDGACRVARSVVFLGYLAGAALGLVLWTQRPGFPLWPIALEAALAGPAGAIGANHRYRFSRGVERQRMQWFGWAVVVGGEVLVVAIAVRLLSGWPSDRTVIAAAATLPLPLALVIGSCKGVIAHIDRLLAATVSLLGLSGVVVGVYLVIVVGLGRVPTHQERSLLVLSMGAAAVAALLYLPARERLARFSNRLVYGEREAPDQVLRTFGTRLTRALPLDELLLQVAESLRKTLALTTAEVWTGAEGQLDRVVSVPDAPTAHLSLNHDEETVLSRAGVSGQAWLAIWLPQLLAGRETAIIRVAPINHSGRLLGLIVAVRPEGGRCLRRRRRNGAGRAGPPAGAGAAQRPARLGAPGVTRGSQAPGRGAAGLPGPHRGRVRRGPAPDRAQPARRGPAAPGRPGREPAPGPAAGRRQPRRGQGGAGPAVPRHRRRRPGAARPGPWDLPAPADGPGIGGGAQRGRGPGRHPDRGGHRGHRPLPPRGGGRGLLLLPGGVAERGQACRGGRHGPGSGVAGGPGPAVRGERYRSRFRSRLGRGHRPRFRQHGRPGGRHRGDLFRELGTGPGHEDLGADPPGRGLSSRRRSRARRDTSRAGRPPLLAHISCSTWGPNSSLFT